MIRLRRFKAWLRRYYLLLSGGAFYDTQSYNEILNQGIGGPIERSDLSDHIPTLFFFASQAKPQLMVELGTRGGVSTQALLAAAELEDAHLLSIDLEGYLPFESPFLNRWSFVRDDDVHFGRNSFENWCSEHGMDAKVDLLFIDTSHWYEHTKEEIKTWFPYLSNRAVVLLHDTNMGTGEYFRRDGSYGIGMDNKRGVISVLEELFGRTYDENAFFCDSNSEFDVLHFPSCSGMTVLAKR